MDKKDIEQLFNKCSSILEERGKQYSSDDRVFRLTATLWQAYIDTTMTDMKVIISFDVKMMMALHKLAREINKHKDDNIIDAINYLALYQEEVANAHREE